MHEEQFEVAVSGGVLRGHRGGSGAPALLGSSPRERWSGRRRRTSACTREIIPDSGHFPWLEQPEAFREAVARLFARAGV